MMFGFKFGAWMGMGSSGRIQWRISRSRFRSPMGLLILRWFLYVGRFLGDDPSDFLGVSEKLAFSVGQRGGIFKETPHDL